MIEHYKTPNYIELIWSLKDYNKDYSFFYISQYISFIKNNGDIFNNSIKSLSDYTSYFNSIFYDKEKIMRTVSPIYMSFNRAINLRHLEYSAYSNIFNNVVTPCSLVATIQA